MLPAAARMRRRTEFAVAVRTGRRAGSRALTLHLAARPDDAGGPIVCPRVGFVVPRSVGPAVVRNRIRRRLRHLLRDRLAAVPSGSSLVVRVGSEAAALSFVELAGTLDASLGRLSASRDISRAVQ